MTCSGTTAHCREGCTPWTVSHCRSRLGSGGAPGLRAGGAPPGGPRRRERAGGGGGVGGGGAPPRRPRRCRHPRTARRLAVRRAHRPARRTARRSRRGARLMLGYVLRDLLRNPRRTLASVAGVALAVGVLSGLAFLVRAPSAQI